MESLDREKEVVTLAALEAHDADTPANVGYVVNSQDDQGESRASTTSKNNVTTRASADLEKGSDVNTISADDGPQDPNIVWWDGESDPQNPMNWSGFLKGTNIVIVSALCFIVPLASSMFAPGIPQVMAEFESTSSELAGFVVSVFILGFAVGPLIIAPASEIWGRLWVYHITNFLFVVMTVACAVSTSLPMLIVFRFLAGCFGAAPLTITGGTIADLVRQEKRGAAMAGFSLGPLLGPVIGPVAGGFLSGSRGWRWDFWVITIVSGAFSVIGLIFLRETYAPVLLLRKTKRLQQETGNTSLRSKLDNGLGPKEHFRRSIIRPIKMLLFSPIVLLLSLYMGIVYGYLYLLFTTFTVVFSEQYHFSTSTVGLSYLGLGIGNLLGLVIFGVASDKLIKAKAEPNPSKPNGSPTTKPEWRLPPMIPGALLLPIGLFIYGWTAQYKIHYLVPITGTLLVGIGNISIFMSISTYLIDAYTIYAASAMAANTVLRSTLGAFLPLAGESMYEALGLGWGNSLLGFIALALVPVPWVFFKHGERIRAGFDTSRL